MPSPHLRLNSYNYQLPLELIAQEPVKPCDHSRLLILDRAKNRISHDYFYHLPEYLKRGDVLVFNNTKVFPARLHGKKITGGKIEVFLLREIRKNYWSCLLGHKKKKEGLMIKFKKNYSAKIIKNNHDGTWILKFNKEKPWQAGETPTPPYIKKKTSLKDYQTIYAKEQGSVAAPTAGFHFTKKLFKKLKANGVQLEFITLHVGLGTFAPVKTEDITKHKMHMEYFFIAKDTLKRIKQAEKEKRRIICVGTTSCRTLESSKHKNATNIFIYPGYKFKSTDALITNFHLPKSTLLMLVSAFAGTEKIKKAYAEAIQKKYRFYSFGDAMLII